MRDATDVTILLDRSGSMAPVWSDMIGGINAFVEKQREVEGDCAISFIVFDNHDDHEVVCENRNVREFTTVSARNYLPRGGTPLLDAMAKAIECTGERLAKIPELHRPDKVIFICVTDGEENSSHKTTRAQLSEMITRQRELYKWQFVFLGANFDVFAEAGSIGVPVMAAASYHYSSAGVTRAFMAAAVNTAAVRNKTRDSMDWTAQEQAVLASDPTDTEK